MDTIESAEMMIKQLCLKTLEDLRDPHRNTGNIISRLEQVTALAKDQLAAHEPDKKTYME